MDLRIDDSVLDPDLFIKTALEQRIEAINKQLEQLSLGKPGPVDQKTLIAARSRFAEALRPYRAIATPSRTAAPSAPPEKSVTDTARPASSPSTASPSRPAPPAPLPAAAAPPSRSRLQMPEGAIPRPRRFAEPPVTKEQRRPAPRRQDAASQSGMVSFLKSVQSQAKEQVIPSVARAESAAREAGREALNDFSDQDGMREAPRPQSAPLVSYPPAQPAAPIGTPKKGNMLSYLEKMRAGSSAPPASASDPSHDATQPDSTAAETAAEAAKKSKQGSSTELSSELKGLLDEIK
ncbi:MAG: hypothetical protein AAB229_07745 [Candidatus Hydrogenedentota bacterium]